MVTDSSRRPSPEQLLAQVEHEEHLQSRGRLKILLGYASGVGKSFQMLDEGRRRSERGEDVVVCAVQPQYSAEMQAVLEKLEVLPPLKTGDVESIDVEAVLRRNPQVALVDGLAYDNPPGSRNPHRWQDVEQLLEAGISVIATVNLQYIEELRDKMEPITGKRVFHAFPRSFLERANEIVVVDAPVMDSISHGAQPADRAVSSEEKHRLSRLREMALLVVAEVVDRQLESYLRLRGMDQTWGVQERILVCVTPRSNAARMLESGRRNADRFHGELYVVHVRQPALLQKDRAVLRQNLSYARQLGARAETLSGLDAVDAIVKFARAKGITQIFIGHSMSEGAWRHLWSNFIERLIRSAEGIDVIVFPH